MQKSKTHFEQIPVETVKQIAEVLPAGDAALPEPVRPVNTDQKAPESKERWLEQDPTKMIQLVDQLIARFDEENARPSRNGGNGNAPAPQA